MKNWSSNISRSISGLLAVLLLSAGVQDYRLIRSVPVEGRFLTTDNLLNAYVITHNNELIKYDAKGNQSFLYSQRKYGDINFVDATNPLKLLLFCPEFSTVILLDNTLSPTGMLNLQEIGMFNVGPIALAFDNNIWVYDGLDFKLKKINEDMEIVAESDDLSITVNKTLLPNFLLERNSWVYLNDPDNGILVFDNYTTYHKTIPVKGLKSFQIIGDQLIYFRENALHSYHLKKLSEQENALPDSTGIRNARLQKEQLFLLKKNQLDLYAF